MMEQNINTDKTSIPPHLAPLLHGTFITPLQYNQERGDTDPGLWNEPP